MKGLIVISVPKCGTNFLSRYLASITGWTHRWGRPSRDFRLMQSEIPAQPDPYVFERAVHLVYTDKDLLNMPETSRPAVFGGRQLVAVEHAPDAAEAYFNASRQLKENVIIAEHPVRSLPYFLRNPQEVPVITPAEIERDAAEYEYGVIFLYRELKDIVNSLAHFLHAGTRYVQFQTLEDSFEVVVNRYAPVLARSIRIWKAEFSGMKIAYETLSTDTGNVLNEICNRFTLATSTTPLISSTTEFPTFTLRKGGYGDWRNHMSPAHSRLLDEQYPDLVDAD